MADKNIKEQLEIIKQVLEQFKDGISLQEMMGELPITIAQRTLLRRLNELVYAGEVTTTGNTRSYRYHLVTKSNSVMPIEQVTGFAEENIEDAIPLSNEAKQILQKISRPLEQRIPVRYNRQFLAGYLPNQTNYLSSREKIQLSELGKIPGPVQMPAGTYARRIYNRLLIDLSWNSSRLEGNTYSLLDTERLIKEGQEAEEKSAMEAQMILNHKEAIEFILQPGEEISFNRYTITNLHALLSSNLLPDPAAPGRLRTFPVNIGRSLYRPPDIPGVVEEMFDKMLKKASRIEDPFEQALFIMVQLPYLQPFEDVNKRVSRIAANIPLSRHNLSPLTFIGVPMNIYIKGLLAVYELNEVQLLKEVFIWAYEKSADRYSAVRQSIGEPDLFKLKYRDGMKSLIKSIITARMAKSKASVEIKKAAGGLPEADREKFIETVETELMSLHEGNFARYMVTPEIFRRWSEHWH